MVLLTSHFDWKNDNKSNFKQRQHFYVDLYDTIQFFDFRWMHQDQCITSLIEFANLPTCIFWKNDIWYDAEQVNEFVVYRPTLYEAL